MPRSHNFPASLSPVDARWIDSDDDEGMGTSDEDEGDDEDGNNIQAPILEGIEAAKAELTMMQAELDSGFASTSSFTSASSSFPILKPFKDPARPNPRRERHSAPSILKTLQESSILRPDYKLLHQTHIKLRNRILSASYKRSYLQTRGSTTDAHTNTIYCLQLYTYPDTGKQVLFTGSRDKTVREWNLGTSQVERVISDVHNSSILSICVHNGYLATAGSDRQVAVWDLATNTLVKMLADHDDSVLCVRFDDRRLVSCSKGRFSI